jgi:hypothetical protein
MSIANDRERIAMMKKVLFPFGVVIGGIIGKKINDKRKKDKSKDK